MRPLPSCRGSSPLARGLLRRASPCGGARRIIPARAGFTASSGSTTGIRAGSSPLARGLLLADPRGDRAWGIIPARAGFTMRRATSPTSAKDHPRSRGVYRSGRGASRGGWGSSPLARGLLAPYWDATLAALDHPRSRGVYQRIDAHHPRGEGSSPLARGLPPRSDPAPAQPRIIPARAGFTGRRSRPSRSWEDHPRSRGVYNADPALVRRAYGSSPLARGLRCIRILRMRRRRIIPARAGFTPG